MRPAVIICTALLATLAALAASCGGSSSETPWPVEPAPALMSPAADLAPLPVGTDAGRSR
jgi:hypothetical protein